MRLQIQIEKRHNDRSILRCTREDGSSTHTRLYPNLEVHDIAHYVVEQELGFMHAFYGLLSRGHAITDFELPKEQRPLALIPSNLHPEALITEHLVNLLQIDYQNLGGASMDILKALAPILEENGLPFPGQLHQERLNHIQQSLKDKMWEWNAVPTGSCLTLVFEIASSIDTSF